MPNRLATATSPYLLQHAGNPVDWYPWGDAAFARSRAEDKPVLLSVGYSSCHWCHVMAHESFEDATTAAVMNELFVNIKVDREERPDVDAIYMEAVQAMTGRGGWPMTVFLTPDGEPFFAGTYFPGEDRHGMPSFRRVLGAVAAAWQERRHEVLGQAGRLAAAIGRSLPVADVLPGREALESAYRTLIGGVDAAYGGFGDAPKFPQQPSLEFLLRVSEEPWAPEAGPVLREALAAMAAGGIYDQVGGGFARYSVDRQWLIPHFEKMLYDNAQLARLYLWGWRRFGDDDFRRVAEETLEYLLRDLRNAEGGFLSAEDADSEGAEGTFYVWSHQEFHEVVGPDDGPIAAAVFGVTERGNFEGANHLHQARRAAEVAAELALSVDDVQAAVQRARRALQERRSRRERPGLDDKVVAAWNGLAIRAFAEAGSVLGEERYLEAARRAASFVLGELVVEGRLRRTWGKGRASSVGGFLEDVAAMAVGLLVLYAADGDAAWFAAARRLADQIPTHFADPSGGFAASAADAEALIARPKDLMDNPSPAGNSLAAEALLLLSLYTGEGRYRELAAEALRAGGLLIERHPNAAGHLLGVLHAFHRGPQELAVVGERAGDLAGVAWERYRPHLALAVSRDGSESGTVPLLADRYVPGRTLAYLCRGFVCDLPVDDAAQLRVRLDE